MASARKSFTPLKPAFPGFQNMEKKGYFTAATKAEIPALCEAMIPAGESLLDGIGAKRLSRELLDDLTLLTSGPQLRGGANVKRGAAGIVKVFGAIHDIVRKAAINAVATRIEIKNAAGRTAC